MLTQISVVIIVKNGATMLPKTLDSVKAFSEVVVYDNGSTDDTIAIAKSYPNVNLIQGDFLGFGQTKNLAATYAKHDWILSLDADEVLTAKLVSYLTQLTPSERSVYQVLRRNFYQKKHIRHCWGNDNIVRLYHRKNTAFNNKKVHEKIQTKGMTVQVLEGFIDHYPYQNISDFIIKADIYSTEFAKDNVGKKPSSPIKAVLNGGFSFFKTYLLKRGFLDGYAGLVIAFSHMITNFYKYIKLYELNKKR